MNKNVFAPANKNEQSFEKKLPCWIKADERIQNYLLRTAVVVWNARAPSLRSHRLGNPGETNGDRTRSEQRTKTNNRSKQSYRMASVCIFEPVFVLFADLESFERTSSECLRLLESSAVVIFRPIGRFFSLFRTCSITVRVDQSFVSSGAFANLSQTV
jgi:hypothetical protein